MLFSFMQKLLLVFIFLRVFTVSAQKVEGTVKDTEGNILPFASILVKGTPQGVSANNEGEFSIKLAPGNYTLDCRYVGYTSQEKQMVFLPNILMANIIPVLSGQEEVIFRILPKLLRAPGGEKILKY